MNAYRNSSAALGFALLSLSPAGAFAQAAAPPQGAPPAPASMETPDPARMATMREARAASERIHAQARVTMLGALTPQHRTQFAAIVGAYATAATPDLSVTAKEIDTLLSAREARAIVLAEETARTNERSLHEAERARMEATLTPTEREEMQARMQAMKAAHPAGSRLEPSSDPGLTLLRTTLGMGGHRGAPPEPR